MAGGQFSELVPQTASSAGPCSRDSCIVLRVGGARAGQDATLGQPMGTAGCPAPAVSWPMEGGGQARLSLLGRGRGAMGSRGTWYMAGAWGS